MRFFPPAAPMAANPWPTVAASAIAASSRSAVPEELPEADVPAATEAWARAARRAVQAGFEFIEIHGAHGYLLHTFLSPLTDHRTDGYGGDAERRMRFPLEVAAAVRAAAGPDVALSYRVSALDGLEGGLDLDDTVRFSRELAARGVDLIDCSSGGIRTPEGKPGDIRRGFAFHAPYSSYLRERIDLPVAAVGLIVDPEQAEAVLLAGDGDVIAIGREMLLDPNWVLSAEVTLTGSGHLGWPRQFGTYLAAASDADRGYARRRPHPPQPVSPRRGDRFRRHEIVGAYTAVEGDSK